MVLGAGANSVPKRIRILVPCIFNFLEMLTANALMASTHELYCNRIRTIQEIYGQI